MQAKDVIYIIILIIALVFIYDVFVLQNEQIIYKESIDTLIIIDTLTIIDTIYISNTIIDTIYITEEDTTSKIATGNFFIDQQRYKLNLNIKYNYFYERFKLSYSLQLFPETKYITKEIIKYKRSKFIFDISTTIQDQPILSAGVSYIYNNKLFFGIGYNTSRRGKLKIGVIY